MLPANTMHLLLAVMLPLASMHLSCAVVVPGSDSASASALSGSSSRHKRESRVMDLKALRDNLASIEDNLSEFQKRSCAVGLNSHHCAIAHLDDVMQGTDYLSGGFSPGKRDSALPDDVRSQAEILLQNLSEQKQAVKTLRNLLSKLGARAEQQAKRTCAFRLGNHCLTEALDHAANQYYYLQSPASPGRRRRQAEKEGQVEEQKDSGRLRLRRRRANSEGQTRHQQQQQQQRLFHSRRRR